MKKTNRRGFTLMEMLIVVAIIAILIAIAIPTLTATLEKARETADLANIRSAYGEAMIKYLDNAADPSATTPTLSQRTAGWQYTADAAANMAGYDITTSVQVTNTNTVTVKIIGDGQAVFSVN